MQVSDFHQVHQRVKFITLNACASFEIDGHSLIRQSIAMGEKFVAANIIKSDNSYTRNIRPLLESEQANLTKCINTHPIWRIEALEDLPLGNSYVVTDVKDNETSKQDEQNNQQNYESISEQNNDKPSGKAIYWLRLYGALTNEEREAVDKMYHNKLNLNSSLISEMIEKVTKHRAHQKHKRWFKEYSTKNRSTFGKLFKIAKRADLDHLLSDWLNSTGTLLEWLSAIDDQK